MVFPLDSKFNELRAVVEDTRLALVAFKEEIRKASGSVGGGGAPSAGGSAGGGGGGGGPSAFVAFSKGAREAVRTIGELQKAAKAGGGLAKSLGLPDAERQLEAVANGLDKVKAGAEGLVAVGKTVAVVWKPVALAAGAAVIAFGAVATVGAVLQEVIFALTGSMLSVGDAITVTLLGAVKGVTEAVAFVVEQVPMIGAAFQVLPAIVQEQMAQVAEAVVGKFRDLLNTLAGILKSLPEFLQPEGAIVALEQGATAASFALGALGARVRGVTAEQAALFAETKRQVDAIRSEGSAAVEAIDAVISETFDKPAGTRFLDDPKKAIEDLIAKIGDGIPDALKKALKTLAEALGSGGSGGDAKAPKQAEAAGKATGTAYGDGFAQSLVSQARPAVDGLLESLTVDPDNGEQITSFRGLVRNIGKLFLSNPFGFLGGLFNTGATGGPNAPGFATGGRVPVRGGVPSLAHLGASGFATGGRAASDTIAAWLTPGEWVMRLAAVKRYGPDVMANINAGRVDPAALRAAAGGGGAPGPSSGPGYAAGGMVGGGAGPQVLPVAFVDQANAGMIVRGGRNALLELFATDPAFRQALG